MPRKAWHPGAEMAALGMDALANGRNTIKGMGAQQWEAVKCVNGQGMGMDVMLRAQTTSPDWLQTRRKLVTESGGFCCREGETG